MFDKINADVSHLEGFGKWRDGMSDAVARHNMTASSEADELNSAAKTAQNYSEQLNGQRRTILNTVQQARQQGFDVSATWQVTDVQSKTDTEKMIRQAAGQAIAAALAQQVALFEATEAAAGVDVTTHAGKLAGVSMTDFKTDKGSTPSQTNSDQLKDQLATTEQETRKHIADLQTRINALAVDAYTHSGTDLSQLPQLASQLQASRNRMGDFSAIDESLRCPQHVIDVVDNSGLT